MKSRTDAFRFLEWKWMPPRSAPKPQKEIGFREYFQIRSGRPLLRSTANHKIHEYSSPQNSDARCRFRDRRVCVFAKQRGSHCAAVDATQRIVCLQRSGAAVHLAVYARPTIRPSGDRRSRRGPDDRRSNISSGWRASARQCKHHPGDGLGVAG